MASGEPGSAVRAISNARSPDGCARLKHLSCLMAPSRLVGQAPDAAARKRVFNLRMLDALMQTTPSDFDDFFGILDKATTRSQRGRLDG